MRLDLVVGLRARVTLIALAASLPLLGLGVYLGWAQNDYGVALATGVLSAWVILQIGIHLALARPLAKLQSALQRVTHGDWTARHSRASANGDLGQLESAVDQIADRLHNQRAEQVRVEQSLRRAAQKFRSIIEHSGDGIVLTDENGVIVEWNRAQEEITGLPSAKAVGRYLWDVQFQIRSNKRATTAAYQQLKSATLRLLKTHQFEPESLREMEIERPDGASRYLQTRTFRIQTPNGYLVGSISRDVTARKVQEEQLAFLALHDPLTGQANRRLLEEVLKHASARARRGIPSTLLLMDADHFKEINDTLGHPAGDQALITLSQLIQKDLRAGDLLARIGGDEFAVLLEGSNLEQAKIVAERMARAVSDHAFVTQGHACKLGLSIGLAEIDGAEPMHAALSHADIALYLAKEQGRGRIAVYAAPDAPAQSAPIASCVSAPPAICACTVEARDSPLARDNFDQPPA